MHVLVLPGEEGESRSCGNIVSHFYTRAAASSLVCHFQSSPLIVRHFGDSLMSMKRTQKPRHEGHLCDYKAPASR